MALSSQRQRIQSAISAAIHSGDIGRVEQITDRAWFVPSSRPREWHVVTRLDGDTWTCTCEAARRGLSACRHRGLAWLASVRDSLLAPTVRAN